MISVPQSMSQFVATLIDFCVWLEHHAIPQNSESVVSKKYETPLDILSDNILLTPVARIHN